MRAYESFGKCQLEKSIDRESGVKVSISIVFFFFFFFFFFFSRFMLISGTTKVNQRDVWVVPVLRNDVPIARVVLKC